MARRLHITLSDEQFSFLNDESERSSVSVAELIRRALDMTYPSGAAGLRIVEHEVGRRPGVSIDRDRAPRRNVRRWSFRV